MRLLAVTGTAKGILPRTPFAALPAAMAEGWLKSLGRRGAPPETAGYCSSFKTSCCTLLAWARAEMPVWLRISYFDMFEAADA